jgi:hypothetical protein
MSPRRLGIVAMGTYLLLACSKETPPAAEEPRSASNAAAPAAASPAEAAPSAAAPAGATQAEAAPAPTGAAKFSDAAFDVSVEAPKSALKAGQAGSVEVVLSAKAPYHVNDKYPIKLKLKETPGVKYENLLIGKDAVKLEAMKAVMPVSFTPDAAGKKTVAGQFSFSVCTDDKCLMEKRDLLLDVTVE